MDQATVGATSEPAEQTPRPAAIPQASTPGIAEHGSLASGRPLLSVVIPCYNEVATIASLIERVRRAPVATKQIIVVDDGSSDGTRELLAGLEADDLTILFHLQNQGKGAALATGFSAAIGEITIVQDADLEYDPEDYPLVIGPIQQGRADVVFGSRFQGGAPIGWCISGIASAMASLPCSATCSRI